MPLMTTWEIVNSPDHILALQLVQIAGVGDVTDFAPWFPSVDAYIQDLITAGLVGSDGDTTHAGKAVLVSAQHFFTRDGKYITD